MKSGYKPLAEAKKQNFCDTEEYALLVKKWERFKAARQAERTAALHAQFFKKADPKKTPTVELEEVKRPLLNGGT